MGCGLLVEAGGAADVGDDRGGAADGQPGAAAVEKQRGVGVGAGPVGAFGEPQVEVFVELGVEEEFADLVAFAVDTQQALASGSAYVVDVEADDFGDAGAGVERDHGNRPVAAGQPGFDGAQPAGGGALVQGARRGGGQVDPVGVGRAEAAADVEVVDGGEGVVDGGGGTFVDGEQVGAPVADGPVPGRGVGEGVAVEVGVGEPARNPRTLEA